MRKKLLFTCLVLSAIFCGKIAAQLPAQSTEDNPVWYYIKVVGSDDTLERVLTVTNDKVEGLPVSYDLNIMNRQLWRFEIGEMGTERGYIITNRATKKKLSVTYNETKGLRMAIVSDNPSTVWRFLAASAGIYNIWMSIEPSEGVAGDINLFQTTVTEDYALSFTGSSNRTNPNARFSFALNDNPIASSDEDIVWMHIQNTQTEKYLTDESLGSEAYFSMETLIDEGIETSQQWKLVYKANSRINFINRATGNIIHTKTYFDRYYYLLNTNDPTESEGWDLEPLGNGQFAIFTTTPEGIVNYWYATVPDEPTTPYTNGYVLNSPYAWTFSVADEESSVSIEKPSIQEDTIRIYAYNKRIYVEGYNDYRIISIYGTPVPRNENLPTGIYLVTVKGRTTKVFVK